MKDDFLQHTTLRNTHLCIVIHKIPLAFCIIQKISFLCEDSQDHQHPGRDPMGEPYLTQQWDALRNKGKECLYLPRHHDQQTPSWIDYCPPWPLNRVSCTLVVPFWTLDTRRTVRERDQRRPSCPAKEKRRVHLQAAAGRWCRVCKKNPCFVPRRSLCTVYLSSVSFSAANFLRCDVRNLIFSFVLWWKPKLKPKRVCWRTLEHHKAWQKQTCINCHSLLELHTKEVCVTLLPDQTWRGTPSLPPL